MKERAKGIKACARCGSFKEDYGYVQNGGQGEVFRQYYCTKCNYGKGLPVGWPESLPDFKKDEVKEGVGAKFDSGKQRWFSMPLKVLKGLADVFKAGEKKYACFNCLQPFEDSNGRFWDATMRHLEACQLDPLARDEETGCYHGYQVAFSIIMRTYHAEQERDRDAS